MWGILIDRVLDSVNRQKDVLLSRTEFNGLSVEVRKGIYPFLYGVVSKGDSKKERVFSDEDICNGKARQALLCLAESL